MVHFYIAGYIVKVLHARSRCRPEPEVKIGIGRGCRNEKPRSEIRNGALIIVFLSVDQILPQRFRIPAQPSTAGIRHQLLKMATMVAGAAG